MSLYKYVRPERIDVLQHELIRYTQATACNDPFELRLFFEEFMTSEQYYQMVAEKPIDVTEHLRHTYDELPAEFRAIFSWELFAQLARLYVATPEFSRIMNDLFATGYQVLRQETPKMREALRQGLAANVGILSLTARCDNELMWAHYADEHRGFVICVNEQHPYFNRRRSDEDEFFHLRQVVYTQPAAVRSLMDIDGTEVLCRKAPAWSYEEEWRLLAPVSAATQKLEPPEGPIYLFEFPAGCVEGAILGMRASSELKAALARLKARDPRYAHLTLRQAVLDERTGDLRFEDLPED